MKVKLGTKMGRVVTRRSHGGTSGCEGVHGAAGGGGGGGGGEGEEEAEPMARMGGCRGGVLDAAGGDSEEAKPTARWVGVEKRAAAGGGDGSTVHGVGVANRCRGEASHCGQ